MKNFFSLSLVSLFFISCATPTPYQPSDRLGRGYRDQKLDKDKFRVSFKGNKLTERATVEEYLFYRAAELAVSVGYDYFTMTNMSTDRKTEYEQTNPLVYGFYGQDRQRFPYYIYGLPGQHRGSSMEHNEYEAVAFVAMSKDRPKDKQEVYYEAQEVLKNLKDKIKKPD